MNIKKALFVVAHPDDETLGCGGIIKKLTQKNIKVFVLVVAEGSTCRFPNNKVNSLEARNAIKKRQKQALQAFKILGVKDYKFSNLRCGSLNSYPLIDLNKIVEDVLNKFKPDTVFTHSRNDTNIDHTTIFKSVMIATRPLKNCTVEKVLSFEILSSTELNFGKSFNPNVFFNIENEIKYKLQAFEKYIESEGGHFPFPRSLKSINNLSMLRGSQIGVKNAEAFELIRMYEK